MGTRLSDVAARVNLSTGLVSRVLNDRPGVWASEETRTRIHAAARELGYRPNAAARSLRSGKTGTVAFVFALPIVNRDIIEAFAEQLSDAGYQLLVQAFPTQEQVLAHLSEMARSRSCDAVILWGSHAQVSEQGRLLDDLAMPFVAKGRFEDAHPGWLQVDVGHEDMMARAVEHLVERGLPRGSPVGYLEYATEEPFARLLRQGLASALVRCELKLDPALIVSGEVGTDDFGKAVETWLNLPVPTVPCALVVGAGSTAWRTIELALARRGRRIGHGPGEMPVVGTAGPEFVLLSGDAHTFRGMHTLDMARALVDRLLLPLLQNGSFSSVSSEGPESTLPTVVRLRPALEPVPSLRILEHGFCLSAPPPPPPPTALEI